MHIQHKSLVCDRCEELVSRLMAAYNTPTGIPYNTIQLDTLEIRTHQWTKHSLSLSEYGSQQLELVKLSQFTGNATYGQKAERVIQLLHRNHLDKVALHGLHALVLQAYVLPDVTALVHAAQTRSGVCPARMAFQCICDCFMVQPM